MYQNMHNLTRMRNISNSFRILCIYVDNKTTCRCNVESVKNHNLQNKGVL